MGEPVSFISLSFIDFELLRIMKNSSCDDSGTQFLNFSQFLPDYFFSVRLGFAIQHNIFLNRVCC